MREFLLKFTGATRLWLLLMILTLPATTMVGQTTFVADSLGYSKKDLPSPTITSDKDDYAPGDIAIIEGFGWTLDGVVDIHIEEEPTHLHHHGFHGTAVNEEGYWRIEYPITVDHIGVKFTVIVDGLTSKYQGRHIFTDGFIKIGAAPNGTSYYIDYKVTTTFDCSGSAITITDNQNNPPSNTDVLINSSGDFTLYNVDPGSKNNPTQYIQITASETSVEGGAFLSWQDSGGTTISNNRSICIQGTNPTRVYNAVYSSCTA